MYKAKIISVDFEESTMEFEIQHEFIAKCGEYVILTKEEFEELSKKANEDVTLLLPPLTTNALLEYKYLKGYLEGYNVQEPIDKDDLPEGYKSIDEVYDKCYMLEDIVNNIYPQPRNAKLEINSGEETHYLTSKEYSDFLKWKSEKANITTERDIDYGK